ncbi:hypothetical protein TUBRATIS_22820 [Tubulinosema ratisbonensis]|uniref:Uncharacterized protein n=1 Tax=Tubulinosema ratisbonensis TaxID=291195 RepID=A0A437AJA6_9MICR|nr:hypothetical protein TUBRATIS_22820 [Tubulinosema ratisbonensis]
MVLDYSKFKELESSSEEIHINIDRKTWSKLKKNQKEEKKKLLQEELTSLENKSNKTKEDLKRMDEISHKLKPKFVEVDSSTFTCEKGSICDQGNSTVVDFLQPLLFLMTHNSLTDFINLIDDNNYDLSVFEEFCLYNLAENIKSKNEAEAKILSKIALYFKFSIQNGKSFVKKLNASLGDEKILAQFEKEVEEFYLTCKESILNLKKE